MTDSTYLTEKQFCDRYHVSPRTAQRWRISGEGPTWVRFGRRRVGYRLADCEAWTGARTFAHRAAEIAAKPVAARSAGGKPLKDTAKGAGDGFKLTTFNARVESCAGASTFKAAFQRRRCIVPASAWYEWTGAVGSKVKHTFRRADGKAIWFAGLWDRVTTPDAGELASFTIMTGPSTGWLGDYHDRAPRILEEDDWAIWLDPARDAQALLDSVRPERFEVAA